MVIDVYRCKVPFSAIVLEVSDELPLFRIDAEDGKTLAFEAFPQGSDVFKLPVAVRAGRSGDRFPVGAQRKPHVAQEPGHGVGGDFDVELAHQLSNFLRRLARPSETGHWVAGGIVL